MMLRLILMTKKVTYSSEMNMETETIDITFHSNLAADASFNSLSIRIVESLPKMSSQMHNHLL